MRDFTQLKNNVSNNTLPDQYIQDAAEYAADFQIDHNGILNTDYLAEINNHYANPAKLTRFFAQINAPIKFKNSANNHFYKVVLNGNTDPINIESITKDDINSIHIVRISERDKQIVFNIIDDMVEEYLDETDSVHL